MNDEHFQELAKQMILELGEDPERDGLRKTPKRMAKAWQKICGGYGEDIEKVLTTFENEGCDEMIIIRDVEFYSTCEHHLLPFYGTVTVAYIPDKKIVGLSKIPRVIDIFARRLQNQERLTTQIAEALEKHLKPKGVAVLISSKHMCVMARGVEKQLSFVQTSALKGLFKKDHRTRMEFLQLAKKEMI